MANPETTAKLPMPYLRGYYGTYWLDAYGGDYWEIRRSPIHPEYWQYRKPGDEFWKYPPNFWHWNRRRKST